MERDGGVWRFGSKAWSIAVDAYTGALVELRMGNGAVASCAGGGQTFDLRQDGTWLIGGGSAKPRLESVEPVNDSTVKVTVRLADWQVAFLYRLFPGKRRLCASCDVTWNGQGETKLKGLWFAFPRIPLSLSGRYFMPSDFPPEQHLASDLHDGVSRHASASPRALVAEVSPELTFVTIADEMRPYSDQGSVSVREAADGVAIGHGFNALARMKPGVPQRIGDAWLWAVAGDGEAGLESIHGMLADLGEVHPADRPAWFPDCILYCLHPGGTIGSRFRDLGGFAWATDWLLTEVAGLGCTGIWVMPIEDLSPYHPRDYYRLQQGLGTPDEYRHFVNEAHSQGIHVLQDIVPHGGSNTYPRAIQHPEWLVQKEDGSTLSYWCFDFNWPAWRDYVAGVATYYVHDFGVDGYRVDASSGSKIPNWNPEIPYGRASFAKLQGGLNMLRSIRGAVKKLKPREGGLLAETRGSVYGAVSDAIYDFPFCYQVLHELRKRPAAEFTPMLREWLHNQRLSETADLLRLRHIESHDSLRSESWYGPEAQRALMALATWIHGIPLVYLYMENGSSAVFRRIFHIRRALPELNSPSADYVSVQCPAELFACVRQAAGGASVVLINLSPDPLTCVAHVPGNALPEDLRFGASYRDMWTNEEGKMSAGKDGSLDVSVSLPAYGFTVRALRAQGMPPGLPRQWLGWEAAVAQPTAAPAPAALEQTKRLTVTAGPVSVRVDAATGLPQWVEVRGRQVMGAGDLHLPQGLAANPGNSDIRQADGSIIAERSYGGRRLRLVYRSHGDAVSISGEWLGGPAPAGAALALPVVKAQRWYAAAGEGLFEDDYRVRHPHFDGTYGSIYWRMQGTSTVWDSLLNPFGTTPTSRCMGALTLNGREAVTLVCAPGGLPARCRWVDRVNDDQRLTAVFSWSDPEAVAEGVNGAWEILLRAAGPPVLPVQAVSSTQASPWLAADIDGGKLIPMAGGWRFENSHYALRLSRGGTITEMRSPRADGPVALAGGDFYTDAGFSPKRVRYAASNEVEAAARIWRDGDALHIRFDGRLRGTYRFDKLDPPIEYIMEYVVGAGPSLRVKWAARPAAPPTGERAFLALFLPLPQMERFRYERNGKLIAEGGIGDGSKRTFETKLMDKPEVPDRVVLTGAGGRVLSLSDIVCGGAAPITNVFVHGRRLFLTWYDGPPQSRGAGQWRWGSALLTPGTATPVPIGRAHCAVPPEAPSGSLLRDPGFEEIGGTRLVSLRTGKSLPVQGGVSPWVIPSGGGTVSVPVHSGDSAAEVLSHNGQYLLWRQGLPLERMPAGSRWRLSAWVKGDAIERGDISWKVGTVRFGVTVGSKTAYTSCTELLGTFDWKQVSVDLMVPEDAARIEVQTGLNGANGRIWMDDMQLKQLPVPPPQP